MTSSDAARRALIELTRSSGRDVLATLARWTGDLTVAEDAVQDATMRALQTWERDGVPENPVAWLRLTARRRAVDLIRREIARRPKERLAVPMDAWEDEQMSASVVADDLLRLVFTCCHPSLAPATQVAMAPHTLCGLTTAEVARALLVSEPTMARRLTRARQKIRQAHIPYRVPPDHELPHRWSAVLSTLYLLFNEGYTTSAGDDLVRPDLVEEAVRLARLMVRIRPDDVSAQGLLALMLLQDSRRASRTTGGAAVLLSAQDRTRWRSEAIDEGVRRVGACLRHGRNEPDVYVVQAAIAACHALAPSWERTDWNAIVSWYDVLLTVDDGPVVRLNRAVALGERDGPQIGLDAVDAVTSLDGYALWHASRAVLLHRLGQPEAAAAAERAATKLPLNAPQLRFLTGQVSG